jgi:hypothetical protein
MRKIISAAAVALGLAALTGAPAGAATGPAMLRDVSPTGTASNTASVATSEGANLPAHGFTATSAQISCADVVYRVTSVATTTATVDPSYSGCSFVLNGTPLAPVTVDSRCTWDLSFANATFNSTNGAGTGGTVTTCPTQMTLPAIGCTIDIAAQTREGISAQNVDTSGANSALATPWGSKITANVSGITYTTTGSCPGLSAHGNDASYTGSLYVKNVFGVL